MAISQNHIINIQPGVSAPLVIHCSQGDTGSVINLTVVNGDETFDCSSYLCSVHGVRSDGANWGPYPVTVNGSTVSFPLRSAMTAIAGPCLAEISVGTVGTANFAILVENATFSLGVTYTEDTSVYQSILNYIMGAVQNIQTEANANVNQAIDQMNTMANDLQNQYDVTNAKLDTAISAATQDSEVQDIRVKADGTSAATAGNAVREQFTELKNNLTRLNDGGLILRDDVIAENVTDWLDAHPEATTTVQDGSLTEVKLADSLKLKTIKDYVTPEMFGAKGDGTTDDTSAFQNMFENADYIFIPDKSYAISTVNVPNKDVVIDGVGKLLVNGSGLVFNAPLKRKEIRNIHFELDDDSGVCAMGFYGSSSTAPFNTITIDNVTVKAAALSGKLGIDIQSENEALLSNVSLYGCAMNVINSINPSIVNCVFRHSHVGIYNANTDTDSDRYGHACGLKVLNTTVLGCTVGIKSVQCDSIQIQSCMIDYDDYPIIILGTDEPVIDNCYLSSRSGNPVIYIAKNNSDSGVFGGNGINAEGTSDSKITNCYVVMHDEALTNSAVIIKNGFSHVISNVTVAYGGKSCVELHDVQNTLVTNCNLRSSISGAKALTSYKNGALGDDGSNKYANINTVLPIYVRNAQTDISTVSFVTERRGSVIVDAQTNSTTVYTYIPQGIDYAIVYTNELNPTYSENGANLTITIPEHTTNKRINWIAFGKRTYSSFS